MRPISELIKELSIETPFWEPIGHHKAKIHIDFLRQQRTPGKLVLVTAVNPTPAGEGKTTTSIALGMGLRQIGKKAVLALREPSLGPVFGVKGGGTGGGKATLEPAADINLHFNGDIHAITSAHNLLAALVDNAVYHNNTVTEVGALDGRRITWGRALDMNDRFLRHCIVGLGGKSNGTPRETYFDITAASEIMAVMALSHDLVELQERLDRIVLGQTADGKLLTTKDIGGGAALVALLRDALKPNLVQTAEGGPAFVHCGPFANIAHGCNSVLATKMALASGEYAVTEAGFGFDLGGEKFLNIKCRSGGIWPHAVVIVATLRSLRMHGGVPANHCGETNLAALERGLSNLQKHIETAAHFGLPAVISINIFPTDTEEELRLVEALGRQNQIPVVRCNGFAQGGAGSKELATAVVDACRGESRTPKYTYDLTDSLATKIQKIATHIYGAKDVNFSSQAQGELERWQTAGFGHLPVCMAKTQYSLSDDPKMTGRPKDFTVHVRHVRLSAGAGFAVALTGDMMTMPGLPKHPAARGVRIGANGQILGLMQGE